MLEDIPIKEQGARPPPQVTTRAPGLVAAHTGMRGLLALWIVIFHSLFYSVGWNLHGSALMPLFFLLSGYSLAIGYGKNKYKSRLEDDDHDRRDQRPRFDFKSFYRNRFARITPVYYVGILIALPLCIFGHGWVQRSEIGRVVATNLFALQMWMPHPAIFNRNIDGPSWTISTLAFFYLIFPWLLKRYQNRTDSHLNRSITVLTVVQAVVFFGLYFGISKISDPNGGFWVSTAWPISRIPVFEMGLVAGLLVLRQGSPGRDTSVKVMGVSNVQGHQWARTVDWGAGIFALFIVVLSIVSVVAKFDLGGSWWLQGVFPFILLQIIVGLSMAEQGAVSVTGRLLNWPPMLFLGRISMSLYLVHEPIIQYVAWIAHPDQLWIKGLPTPMPAWGTIFVIPASFVLAVLLEHYVESPARRYLRSRPKANFTSSRRTPPE